MARIQIKTERPNWVTLKLSDKEKAALEAMAAEEGMSQQAVLRQALRAYQRSRKPVDFGPLMKPETPDA